MFQFRRSPPTVPAILRKNSRDRDERCSCYSRWILSEFDSVNQINSEEADRRLDPYFSVSECLERQAGISDRLYRSGA